MTSWKSTLLTEVISKETYRPIREMAAKIIAEDVEIRIYNGSSREILKNLNNYLWYRDQHVSKYK